MKFSLPNGMHCSIKVQCNKKYYLKVGRLAINKFPTERGFPARKYIARDFFLVPRKKIDFSLKQQKKYTYLTLTFRKKKFQSCIYTTISILLSSPTKVSMPTLLS